MVNGLAVLGWGVGGIEAEAAMLGQPFLLQWPTVIGVRLSGSLKEGTTATDLVLKVTQMLRKHGVVNKFVEFFGPGVSQLTLADRATVSNMSPEYGATASIFPIDEETLRYLRNTGRSKAHVDLVEAYAKEQGLFHMASGREVRFSETLSLDLGSIEPSLAGPRRPQDRVTVAGLKQLIYSSFPEQFTVPASDVRDDVQRFDFEGGTVNEGQESSQPTVSVTTDPVSVEVEMLGVKTSITHGSVVIAAITSLHQYLKPGRDDRSRPNGKEGR